jgi:hypothetical protein
MGRPPTLRGDLHAGFAITSAAGRSISPITNREETGGRVTNPPAPPALSLTWPKTLSDLWLCLVAPFCGRISTPTDIVDRKGSYGLSSSTCAISSPSHQAATPPMDEARQPRSGLGRCPRPHPLEVGDDDRERPAPSRHKSPPASGSPPTGLIRRAEYAQIDAETGVKVP